MMMSSEEHREACRVYMQKYRSKPENREKIRQQNAEYRKRKKLESIRQVSEIGNLEQNLDSYQSRIQNLEKELKEALFKNSVLEQESRIPQSHLNQMVSLKTQLDNKQQQIDSIINASVSSIQIAQNSIATALQGLISAIHHATAPSPPSSPVTVSPSTSPLLQSASNIQLPTPQDLKLKNKTIDLFTNEQTFFSSSQPSPSSPPSSPSLHFLTSPSSSSSNFTALTSSTGSFGLVPDANISSSPTLSSTLKPQESPKPSSLPQLASISSVTQSHVPLSLLCDVLQNETYTNSNISPQINFRPSPSPPNFKTSINFVLYNGAITSPSK